MKQSIKRAYRWLAAIVALMTVALLASCLDEPSASEAEPAFFVESTDESEAADEAESAGEELGAPDEDDAQLLQDCAYIQWCDEPPHIGPAGTVCRVRNTAACKNLCFTQALEDECIADALAVCGEIVEPRAGRGC